MGDALYLVDISKVFLQIFIDSDDGLRDNSDLFSIARIITCVTLLAAKISAEQHSPLISMVVVKVMNNSGY
jgi:hypothetical protein